MYQTSKRKNLKVKRAMKSLEGFVRVGSVHFGLFYSNSNVFQLVARFSLQGCLRTLCGNELSQGHRGNLVN